MEWTENTTRYAFVFAYVPETPPAVEFTSLWTPGFEQYDGFNPVSDSPGVLGGDSSTLGQLGVVFPGDTLPGDFPGWAGIPVLSYTWRYSFPARLEVMCQPLT